LEDDNDIRPGDDFFSESITFKPDLAFLFKKPKPKDHFNTIINEGKHGSLII